MRKLQLILNPTAGQRHGKRALADIIMELEERDFLCTTFITRARGDATRFVKEHGGEYERVVCIGGDGTFNEVVAGLLEGELSIPVGYIPAGSTNDFAGSLHLSSDLVQAAADAAGKKERSLDIGQFNGRSFSYVASFGAFTKASYSTSQSVKHALGHLAYILQGIRDIPQIKPLHVRMETEEKTVEGDYLFGAVSNSTSLGGVLTLDPKLVDMSDGMFEIMLIKSPPNAAALNGILLALAQKNYDNPMIDFLKTSRAVIYSDAGMDWSLDGEMEPGRERSEVINRHDAIRLLVGERD